MKRLIFVVFFYPGNCLCCLNWSYATD